MFLIKHKYYNLYKNVNIYFLKKYNILILKTLLGFNYFFLPSLYFFKNKKNISFIFLKKYFFSSFISHFFYTYLNSNYIYIVRLKIKGLGYKISKINDNIFSFYFYYINFFYLFIPKEIIILWYKKRIVLLSNNISILKIIFKNILLLKKLGPYRLLGIRYPRQIVMLKKSGKSKK